MSKDQGKFGMRNQESLGQGSFGAQQNDLKDSWVCPNCETVNTENACILCGYQKNPSTANNDNSKKTKKLIVAYGVFMLIVVLGVFICFFDKQENNTISVEGNVQEEFIDSQTVSDPAPGDGDTTSEYTRSTNPSYADDAWENNILMNCGVDQENAFGSDIPKAKVASVIFLDTTLDAPDSAWDVSSEKNNAVLAWSVKNGTLYDIYIAGEGGINIIDLSGLFSDFQNLRAVNFNDCVHTSQATDMSFLFAECHKLTKLDLSCIDTSNVDNMNALFYNCFSLNELDLSSFDTSNVVSMMSMFEGCTNLQYVDLHTFNTEKVFTMGSMFSECESLSSVKLDHFVTTSVVDMNSMFFNCQSLSVVDLRSFDTHRVIDMRYMFYGRAITVGADGTEDFLGPHEIFVDEEKFDTSNVIDYEYFHWPEAQLNELPWEEFFASNKSA